MRNHHQVQQSLAVYKELPSEQRARVDAHLRHCAECQRTLAAYTAMDRTLRQRFQHNLQLVTAQPGWQAQPRFATSAMTATYRAPWLDDWIFRLLQPRPLILRLATASALLVLLMALSTLFGGWLPLDQPVLASTPTQMAVQTTQEPALHQIVAITHTPTATPTAISLVVTLTPLVVQ